MPVTEERYVNEFGAAASPDGRQLAFVARGIASQSMVAEGQQPHRPVGAVDREARPVPPVYAQLTPRGARQMWPMWSGDGRTLFYVSDRGGAENVWARPAAATAGRERRSATARRPTRSAGR